jgi:Tfp pilus assembly protein PilO
MAGFVTDFGRRPPGFKIAVFVGVALALGVLYWNFVYVPIEDDIVRARADVQGEIDVQKTLRQEKTEFDDLVVRRDTLATRIEQNQRALPTEAEMPAFFEMLSRKISEAGVEGQKRELKKEVTLDPSAGAAGKPANAAEAKAQAAAAATAGPKTVFLKVPVEIEVTGTFYQLKRFFSSLRPPAVDKADTDAPKERLVTIENLALVDPRVKNNEIVLTARFTASTFRAVTEQPAAPPGAKPPAAGAAGAGAGTGAGTGTGAVNRLLDGPANTPAAAKAQTGAAARKADDRNRSIPDDDEGGP